MAPLTYLRFTNTLNWVVGKTTTDLPGAAFALHRNKVLRTIEQARDFVRAGLAPDNDAAMSSGQIKHWLEAKIHDILQGVTPPQRKCASKKIKAGVKKKKASSLRSCVSIVASRHTTAELGCAAALLELARKPIVF
jgi:hypothetical protein